MAPSDPITLRRFSIASAAVLAFIVVFWALNPPRYLTNDDVTIRLGIEGHAVPNQDPTGFVLMTHAALGWALATLHPFVPSVPLWDITVAATLFLGLAALYSLAWVTLGAGWLARLTALLTLLVATLPAVVGMQFTISATVAGSASVLLVLMEIASPARKPRAAVVVASGGLLLAGLLVRPMGAAAGVFLAALLLVPWLVWQAQIHRHRLMQAGAMLLVTAMLIGGLTYADGLMYRVDREWDAYYRYNWMAAQLAEWGGELQATDTDRVRAAAGWSANDWTMMQRWWGVDPALHGIAQVAKAYEARSTSLTWRDWLRRVAARVAATGWSTIEHVTAESALLAAAVVAVAVAYAGCRGWAALSLGTFLFFCFCIAIEVMFKELPFRLLAPMQASVATAMLVTIGTRRRRPSPGVAILCLAAILTLLSYQMRAILTTAERDHAHTAQVEREVSELQRLSPSLIVIHADAFPSEHWWRPFTQPAMILRTISLGGNNQSPALRRFLTSTGRQPLLRAICNDSSIVIISDEGRLDLITTYFREHLHIAIEWRGFYEGSFTAWRCIR